MSPDALDPKPFSPRGRRRAIQLAGRKGTLSSNEARIETTPSRSNVSR